MDILREQLIYNYKNEEYVDRILKSKVLLVGAGGIGCEVIKGLLLAGFPDVVIVDLDTIDVSNLNRQFLFNKSNVGESKAAVAARVAVERFALKHPETSVPLSVVKPIHGSVLDLKYGKSFYEQFTFVINALDNNTTRAHVNRMCIAAKVAIVESGSSGYLGHCNLHRAGITDCFECRPRERDENTYASCTIRHTPTLPIHCIVWAKHLFAQLFGEADEDIAPDGAGQKDAEQNSNGNDQQTEDKAKSETTREFCERVDYDPHKVFQKIFHHDIVYLKTTFPDMWEKRTPPQEISVDDILQGKTQFQNTEALPEDLDLSNPVIRDQQLWDITKCFEEFSQSLNTMAKRLRASKPGEILTWDKDDDVALTFVTAASNFRCNIFSIGRKSKFDVKSMAGNIIPAIPSTNTAVGGFIIHQSLQLLASLHSERFTSSRDNQELSEEAAQQEAQSLNKNCFSLFINNINPPKTSRSSFEPPNPKCIVCSKNVRQLNIALELSTTTLIDFVNEVVIRTLHCVAPDVLIFGSGNCLWGSDLDELIEMHKKTPKLLSEYSELSNEDCLLTIEDIAQSYSVNIKLVDMKLDMEKTKGHFFQILNENELESIVKEGQNSTNDAPADSIVRQPSSIEIEDDEDMEILEVISIDPKKATQQGTKRELEDRNGDSVKKIRVE